MVIDTQGKRQESEVHTMYDALITSNTNYNLFRKLPLLRGMSESTMQALFSCMEEKRFCEGHTFYTYNTSSRQVMHLILDGKVNVIDYNEEIYTKLEEGDVFGLLSFLDPSRNHSATLRAASDGSLLTMDRNLFDIITLENPILGHQLLFFMFHLLAQTSLKLETEYASMHHFALGRRI